MKMNSLLKLVLITILSVGVQVFCAAQEQNISFEEVYGLIARKNFFKAREIYQLKKETFSKGHQYFIEAIIDNAFNRLNQSNSKINTLLKGNFNFPDSLVVALLKVYEGNAVKLFEYKKAKQVTENILKDRAGLLSEADKEDLNNNLKIWTALQNTPKQKITNKAALQLRMKKDKAGLSNLEISAGTAHESFIFDTGANISTVTRSTARKMGMTLIPAEIEVGSITGEKVRSQLGVCDKLKIGAIEIHNVVFLVFEDKDLYIAPIDFQINGILGFPIISALEEIQITNDGIFIVPLKETLNMNVSNMALDGLTPLIYINDKHFSFDSGAATTLLYRPYYLENKSEIEKNYAKAKINFGGAGGLKEFDGYSVDVTFLIVDKEVQLKEVQLLSDDIKENNSLYGNIGQDVIRQFNRVTLNFKQMFIRFD
jgi:predicted aspartyl protease